MEIIEHSGETELRGVSDFDLVRIFECGQCFRWDQGEDGAYTGVALRRRARIRRAGESVFISGSVRDFESVWRDYFDLDRDYAAIRRGLCTGDYMTAACEFGAGIRILRQDKWEALCSFIISQCNNIPRIKKIIGTLCRLFGDELSDGEGTYYAFPSAERLSGTTPEQLKELRCGYRAPYIISAARAGSGGELDLDALASGEPDDALSALKRLPGVGDKVASCATLFGLGMLDAFPVDVWMKRAIKTHFGDGFDHRVFSPYAGIAQQYIFYYARSGGGAKEAGGQ